MYTEFYNLNAKPFQISSDPAFMWFGEKHKEALATLKYGILDNKGFLLLTGDVGTGKTTLINALLQSLDEDIICTSVPDPGLDRMDFFNFIAAAFGIEEEFATKGKFLAHFRNFLIQANESGKKVLLIIDEAQLLTQEMLEEIRLLSNIEKMDTKLINIFFVGQNEFNEILNRDQNRAVRQRLTLNYNIDPLTSDETVEYINHRLKIAGATDAIFDIPAAMEVFTYSGGFPRRINVICDHSLLSGYVKEEKIITAAIVSECAKELKIPAFIQNRNIDGFGVYNDRKRPSEQTVQPQETIQPKSVPIPVTKNPPQHEKGRRVMTGAAVIILFIAACFFFFPNEFNFAVDGVGKRVNSIRQNIADAIPEPYASVFYNEPDIKKIEKEIIAEETTDTPATISPPNKDGLPGNSPENMQNRETGQIETLSEEIRDLHPIQPDALKKQTGTQPGNEIIIEDTSTQAALDKQDIVNDVPRKESFGAASENKEQENISAGETKVEKKIFPLPKEKVIVRFKYNTNDFTSEGYSKLVKYSEILVMHPEAKVLVKGYTDSEGYQKYNRKLSEFRANIVRSFLLGRGIRPEQVRIKGLGSENPIESNETAWGRMMNRRVEIELVE